MKTARLGRPKLRDRGISRMRIDWNDSTQFHGLASTSPLPVRSREIPKLCDLAASPRCCVYPAGLHSEVGGSALASDRPQSFGEAKAALRANRVRACGFGLAYRAMITNSIRSPCCDVDNFERTYVTHTQGSPLAPSIPTDSALGPDHISRPSKRAEDAAPSRYRMALHGARTAMVAHHDLPESR